MKINNEITFISSCQYLGSLPRPAAAQHSPSLVRLTYLVLLSGSTEVWPMTSRVTSAPPHLIQIGLSQPCLVHSRAHLAALVGRLAVI